MIPVLLDTNVVLDVLLQRHPWFDDGAALWRAGEEGRLRACVCAVSLTNIFFIVKKASGRAVALQAVDTCLDVLTVLPVDTQVLGLARSLDGPDFEDDVQQASAQRWGISTLITRDPAGFVGSSLKILSPSQARQTLLGG